MTGPTPTVKKIEALEDSCNDVDAAEGWIDRGRTKGATNE